MTFEEWAKDVPVAITGDSLWRVEAYRLGLFLSDLAWRDANSLARTRLAVSMADQLIRAAGNISSSVGEGYSRGTGKARAQFYEYSLGSAREARDWYFKARHALDATVIQHRLDLCAAVVRLLLAMISRERGLNRRVRTTPVSE